MNENKGAGEISLAQFVSQRREHIGLSQRGLAQRCNLPVEEIETIESGAELFLSSTVRQKLAKGLRLSLNEIKGYEKNESFEIPAVPRTIEEIKEAILDSIEIIKCPNCGETLITRIAKMYDLEDNLMLHPKAHCSKCPFQIK